MVIGCGKAGEPERTKWLRGNRESGADSWPSPRRGGGLWSKRRVVGFGKAGKKVGEPDATEHRPGTESETASGIGRLPIGVAASG